MHTPRDFSGRLFRSQLATVLVLLASLSFVVVMETGCVGEEDETTHLGVLGQSDLALTSSGRGAAGLSASATNGASTEVWQVTRRWHDVDGEAGLAWGASSETGNPNFTTTDAHTFEFQ